MKHDGRILITGGAGFIGGHTADALKKHGYKVRILDNLEPVVHRGRWPNYIRHKGYELIRGDVRNKKDWERALRGVSYVYHLAAYQDQRPDYSKFFHTNVVGTALLYEVIAEKKLLVKKIILASSQFAYGDGKYQCAHPTHKQVMHGTSSKQFFFPELRTLEQFEQGKFDILCPHGKPATFFPFREDQPLTPTNAYGLSKEALERLAMRFGKTHGIPTVALRYSIVQGPRQSPKNLYSGALRIFVIQALTGKPITVNEDGREMRDFVNIEDVVAANLAVLKNKKADFQVFNVGGGKGYRILDFAKLVKQIAESKSQIVIGGYRRTDTRHAVCDISKLKKLGWRPRHAPAKSIKDYIAWYKQEFLR